MASSSSSFSRYKNKGLSGLVNLGNSCFVNSCLQVLSHTYELNNILDNPGLKSKLKNKYDTALLIEWDCLRKLLWSENCTISPNKFFSTIQKVACVKDLELFTRHSQNDISEFLLFVIDCFHNSLSRKIKMSISGVAECETDKLALCCYEMIKKTYSDEYSEIWNLFYAVHVSEIISIETGARLSVRPEPFFIVSLPIPANNKHPTILDCLNLYVEGEKLDGDNAWFHEESNKKVDIIKKLSFWSLPSILVVDFKRFNSMNQKNQILITFPVNELLDLSNYVIGYKKETYLYELYGVCNHVGGSLGGHYFAFIKNANGKWYTFNDVSVVEVSDTQIVSPKAYCLFYRIKYI